MLLAIGKLVEVETNEKGYRTAHVLSGRYVDSYGVSKHLNGELDELIGAEVVAECRTFTRWFDTKEGRRPSASIVIMKVRGETQHDRELAEAA
jgi:hypothetical protein